MSLSLENIDNAAHFAATAAFSIISRGASLAKKGAIWGGHQIILLGPVLKDAATTAREQTVKVATLACELFLAILTATKSTLSTLATFSQKAFEIGSQFAKEHPRDIKLALASAAITIIGTLLIQNIMAETEKNLA